MNLILSIKLDCLKMRFKNYKTRLGTRMYAYSSPNKIIRKRNINYNKIKN